MPENQGKGPYYQEGRNEKTTSRADEQGKTGSSYAPKKVDEKIEAIKDQTRKDIRKNL